MSTRNPDVLALLTAQITRLESNLTAQIHDVKGDLGCRITELAQRVGAQNGRVGTLEISLAKLETELEEDVRETRINRKRAMMVGTGGVLSGAAIIEVLRWLTGTLGTGGL